MPQPPAGEVRPRHAVEDPRVLRGLDPGLGVEAMGLFGFEQVEHGRDGVVGLAEDAHLVAFDEAEVHVALEVGDLQPPHGLRSFRAAR